MKGADLEQAVILVPFASYDQGSRRYALPARSWWWWQRRQRSDRARSTTTRVDPYGRRLRDLVSFWAAVVKGNGRCAARTVRSAWQRLHLATRRRLSAQFASLADADGDEDSAAERSDRVDESTALRDWKRRLPLARNELIDRVREECPRRTSSVTGLSVDPKRTTLSAFHADVLRVVGGTRSERDPKFVGGIGSVGVEAKSCAGVPLRTLLALQRVVDADATPFPLSLVVLFSKDECVGNALRDYHSYWTGRASRKEAFGQWDKRFWQKHPREKTLVMATVYRYARLKGQRLRYLRLPRARRSRRGGRERLASTSSRCDCSTRVRFCQQCLKMLSYPDVQHVPSGRSVLLDANSCRVACQTCNSSRVTLVPLRTKRNVSVSLTLAHPDRLPVSVCDRRLNCGNVTSNPDGDCRRCVRGATPKW